jgi:transcription factor TGA
MHAETLNIFPSQPMHHIEPSPKVSFEALTTYQLATSKHKRYDDCFMMMPYIHICIYPSFLSLAIQGSMASSSAAVAQVAGPSKNSQAPSLKVGGGPLPAGSKISKAAIKVIIYAIRRSQSHLVRFMCRSNVMLCYILYITIQNQREGSAAGGKHGAAGASSSDQEGPRTPDPKTLRRLAQNREAARKSRLRKKVIMYCNLLFTDDDDDLYRYLS